MLLFGIIVFRNFGFPGFFLLNFRTFFKIIEKPLKLVKIVTNIQYFKSDSLKKVENTKIC